MKTDQSLVRKERRSSVKHIGPIFGTLALLGLAALVITNLHDIRRYIKMTTM